MPPHAASRTTHARQWSSFAFARWQGQQTDVPDAPLARRDLRALGLGPLLHRALADVGDARAAEFAADYRHTTTANLIRFAQASRVRDELARRGVPVVLLKGGAFLARFGAGDLGLRPMADIDMLVDPRHFRVATDGLADLGFSPASSRNELSATAAHSRAFVRDDAPLPVEIDLHRGLAQWPMHRALTHLTLDATEVLGGWRVPSVRDAIAIAAIHRARHGFVWSCLDLVDLRCLIAAIAPDDWPSCLDHLDEHGTTGAVYASLRQALFWFIPNTTEDRVRLDTIAARLSASRRRAIDRIAPVSGALFPHLRRDRPLIRHLIVFPAVTGSFLTPLVAGATFLPLRAVDEWRYAGRTGGSLTGRVASVWRHLIGGARGARAGREHA